MFLITGCGLLFVGSLSLVLVVYLLIVFFLWW